MGCPACRPDIGTGGNGSGYPQASWTVASDHRSPSGAARKGRYLPMQGNALQTAQQFMPRRELGRTGFRATVLGIGDLADRNISLETCVATARRAIDAGLNLIDTAPGYEHGYSEEIVGQAVK